MVSVDRLGAISDRHAKQRDSIIEKLVALLLGLWGDFGVSRDPDQVTALAARSATVVSAATGRMRLQTRSFQSAVFRELGSKLTLPKQVNPYPRANVAPLEVYSRPSSQFVYALSQGGTVEEAEQAAGGRLEQIATTDVVLADRDETHRIYQAESKIIGFRRVIHPELSRTGTCGLCLVASQRLYHRNDLLDIHDGDNCTQMPVIKGDDPGFRLNQDDLGKLYAAAGSKYNSDLLNTRITIKEHGELGPVLVKKGDHFRTPEEAGRRPYVKPTPVVQRKQAREEIESVTVQIEAAQRELADLQKQIPSDLDYDRLAPEMKAAVDRRTTLTQMTKNLRGYVAMLQATARSL